MIKNLFSLAAGVAFLLITSTAVYAQDRLDVFYLRLINPIHLGISLTSGQTSIKCQQVFRHPTQIKRYYAETEEDSVTVYSYGCNELHFLRDKLISYELSDSLIIVETAEGLRFKVGDPLSSVRKAFQPVKAKPHQAPTIADSPVHYELGESRGRIYQASSLIYLREGSTPLDSRYELLFNGQHKLIHIALLD